MNSIGRPPREIGRQYIDLMELEWIVRLSFFVESADVKSGICISASRPTGTTVQVENYRSSHGYSLHCGKERRNHHSILVS